MKPPVDAREPTLLDHERPVGTSQASLQEPSGWEDKMRSNPDASFQRLFVWAGAALIRTLALLVTVEIICCAAWWVGHWLGSNELAPENSSAYGGAKWVSELYKEQASRLAVPYTYVPFTVTGVPAWHGKYFNNDAHPNGVWRRTVDPGGVRCEHNPISVWVFGGSTVYGTGVPDDATLPSYLLRRLNRDGQACVVVTNLGNESFVSTQELLWLIQLLKRGGRPDIVIFYDGFNDAHLGMQTADPSDTHYGIAQIKARAEGTVAGRFDFIHKLYSVRVIDAARQLFRHPTSLTSDVTRSRATSVLDNYQANHEIAAALGQTYHFRFYGFWQPMLFYGNKPLDNFERRITQLDASRNARFDARPVLAAYLEAGRRAPQSKFIFLANVFDSAAEPLYIDEAHLGPRGNELAADAIAKYIEDHPQTQPQ